MSRETEQNASCLPQPPTHQMRLNESGIASALSIDHWSAPVVSRCHCEDAPDLSVNFLCMHPGPGPSGDGDDPSTSPPRRRPPDKAAAARFQEVFVDYVGMQCASLDAASRHVLDDRFDSFLGKGERDFREAMMHLMEGGMSDDARNTPAYGALEEMLRLKMGFRNTHFWSNRNAYQREDSSEENVNFLERGSRTLSQFLMSVASESSEEASNVSGSGSSSDPRVDLEVVRSVLDSIQSNAETCRRLRNSGKDCSEPELRSMLQGSVSKENIDVLFASLNDPSLQDQTATRIFRSLLRPPGHVFVCNASVCDLHCDAFLCPGSISERRNRINGSIPGRWLDSVERNEKLRRHICPYKFKRYEQNKRVVTQRHWPWGDFRSGDIPPVPFFVGGEVALEKSQIGKSTRLPLPSSDQHISALMETARQFIDVALEELRANQPKPLAGRERYLLAMPVIGTGGGCAGDLTGHVIEGLLTLMSDRVFVEGDSDMVLVCADEATYAHAQSIRMNLSREDDEEDAKGDGFETTCTLPCFRWLTDEMRDHARQLARLASSGHLALFLGAGVSMGSGLPGWFSLLHLIEDLFTPTGAPEERKLGTATKWNPLHMANLLDGICSSREDRHGVSASLKRRICDRVDAYGKRPGLLLSLLVSLPCQSVVTQNYDRLIEKAFECWSVRDAVSSKELSVIPYHPRRNARHWLLKMHGCTTASEEITISGNDYDRYESSRYKALGGLLQACLMTKHLLFVGFSLTDPNYLNIVEQVRSALRDDSGRFDVPISAVRNCTV